MRSEIGRRARPLAYLVVVGLLSSALNAADKPSERLSAALERSVYAVPQREDTLMSVISRVLRLAQAGGVELTDKIAIEFDGEAPHPRVKVGLPSGTLRKQLDKVAESAGYIWEANGDWINFIPRGRASDPNHIMNQRIPGKVVLSRDPAKFTSVKEWFDAHRISSAREYSGLRALGTQQVWGPDPIELHNPTLREYHNAHDTLYGNDRSAVRIMTNPSKDGKCPPMILMVSWGQNTRALLQAAPDFTSRKPPTSKPSQTSH